MARATPIEGNPLAQHTLSPSELKHLLAAEEAGHALLAFRDPDGGLELHRLDGSQHTLGRSPEMDLSILWDPEISSLHAEITCLGSEWTLIDDGLSTNGTYVNGHRISGRHRLRNGELIRIGRTTLAYSSAQAIRVQETASAGESPRSQALTETQRRVLVALCRPYRDGESFATPATNQQIAAEVYLSVDAVKMHLRTLFAKLELTELPQNQKRTRLAECALQFGLISRRELA